MARSLEHPPTPMEVKHAHVSGLLREMHSVAVAFSAGADSMLVLKVALDVLGPKSVVAVTGRSDSLARAEFSEACELARAVGAEHVILDTDEFENPSYTSNPTNRCYHCKTTLYTHLERFVAERGIQTIVNGVNIDDLGDYRPGLRAAAEHRIRSPLAEAGFTKADVRELSRRLGLSTHDKPASPCLSSRIPYGEAVTPEKLRMIEAAEAFLHGLGVRECRVRHFEPATARVEVPGEWISRLSTGVGREKIVAHLRGLGYHSVEIDERGFRSGSLNELVDLGTQP